MIPFFPFGFSDYTTPEGIKKTAIQNEDILNKIIDHFPETIKGPDSERTRISDNVLMSVVKEHEEAEKKVHHEEETHSHNEEEKQEMLNNSDLQQQGDEARRRAYSMHTPENRMDHWEEIEFERPNLQRKSSFHTGHDYGYGADDANFLMTRTKRSDSFMEKIKTGIAGISNLFRKGSKDYDEFKLKEGQYAEVAPTEDLASRLDEVLKPEAAFEISGKRLSRDDIFEPEEKENEDEFSPKKIKSKNTMKEKQKESISEVLAERTNKIVSDLL